MALTLWHLAGAFVLGALVGVVGIIVYANIVFRWER